MNWTAALLVALALLGAATALGFVLRARSGRVVVASGGTDASTAAAALGVEAAAFGERATLVQFSTALCSRCPGTARQLGALAAETEGVRHLEIDLTDEPELAARFAVLQTPTTLVYDGAGRQRARIGGPPRIEELARLLDSLTRRTRVQH
ncbi:TlpA family protein disulfide reductase [Agromyces soli]|uniref:Thioredoxin family protein n=1 Tax=Agromyces soli TaxID=659012 RepID=A0ABY4AVE3_9MICO|nr:thioredoxin family protein [Agromyces soli]UOE25791.1 thioredoxin family protein [Agromyces soli]